MTAPCQACHRPTEDRANWGAAVLCPDCLEQAKAPIRQRVIARQGAVDIVMKQAGPGHAELVGPLDHGLVVCSTCTSQWVGRPDAPCPWCEELWGWLLGQVTPTERPVELQHPEQAPIWKRRGVRYVA